MILRVLIALRGMAKVRMEERMSIEKKLRAEKEASLIKDRV
jgi:hypothetical protein